MNREIEEIKGMARAIFETGEAIEEIDLRYACLHGADNDGETKFMRIARCLYRKGYRKSTDVAREIFEDVKQLIIQYRKGNISEYRLFIKLAELQQEYESEGADDGNGR